MFSHTHAHEHYFVIAMVVLFISGAGYFWNNNVVNAASPQVTALYNACLRNATIGNLQPGTILAAQNACEASVRGKVQQMCGDVNLTISAATVKVLYGNNLQRALKAKCSQAVPECKQCKQRMSKSYTTTNLKTGKIQSRESQTDYYYNCCYQLNGPMK